jgi:hypothetical protein
MAVDRKIRDKEASAKRRARNKNYVISKMTPCIRCGFFHPAAMDFHHKDPSTKDKGVSELARCGHALHRLIEEIEKCECICSNCHRILHSEE